MGKKKVVLGCLAGVVVAGVAVGAAGVANASKISAFYLKNFGSPVKYYRYVESEEVKRLAGSYGTLYGTYGDALEKNYTDASYDMSAEVSEAGKKHLEETMGIPAAGWDWVDSISASGTVHATESALSYDGDIKLNDTLLSNVNYVWDVDAVQMVVKLPELSDKYLGIDKTVSGMSEMNKNMADTLKQIVEKQNDLPDKEKVKNVLERYGKIFLESTDDVDREKGVTVEAGDFSVKATKLTATWEGDNLASLSKELMTTMKDDKELEDIINSLNTMVDTEETLSYERFHDSIERELDHFDEKDYEDDSLVMSIYVDGDNRVVGRDVEVNEKEMISYKKPCKKDEFGLEMLVRDEMEKEKLTLSGTGKMTKGVLTGAFDLSIDDGGVIHLDVDKFELTDKKDAGSMDITISCPEQDDVSSISPSLIGYRLRLIAEGGAEDGSVELIPMYEDEELGKISVAFKKAEPAEIKLPAKDEVIFVNESGWDHYLWLRTFTKDKYEALEKRLQEAKVPSEQINLLRTSYQEWQELASFVEKYQSALSQSR